MEQGEHYGENKSLVLRFMAETHAHVTQIWQTEKGMATPSYLCGNLLKYKKNKRFH